MNSSLCYKKLHLGNHSNTLTHYLLFFFIWPFGAWIYSVLTANKKNSYVIFFLFSLLLCWHMSPVGLSGMYDDFMGIYQRFQETKMSTDELLKQIHGYFTFEDYAPKELYESVVIWFVKLFTNNYHFYFLICAIPVAFFQLKSLSLITSDKRYEEGTWLGLIFIILFILPRDIVTVQNPRFTTGFWLCLSSTLYYFSKGRKKIYLVPILISPLIHSALWVYVGIISIYLIIPKNTRLLEWGLICTLPLMFISSDFLLKIDLSQILPPSLYRWSTFHNTKEAYEAMEGMGRAGFWWFGVSIDIGRKVMYAVMAIWLIKKKNETMQNHESSSLYPFFLFIVIVVNCIHTVPVLGERFYFFIRIFTIFIWFKAFYSKYFSFILCLFAICGWEMIVRYGYFFGGALSVNTSPDLFYAPLPYLMGKGLFW